jgi:hypothetical protein
MGDVINLDARAGIRWEMHGDNMVLDRATTARFDRDTEIKAEVMAYARLVATAFGRPITVVDHSQAIKLGEVQP